MSSSTKGLLMRVSWMLAAIGAINWGLVPLGLNLFNLPFLSDNLGKLQVPFYYLIGAAGIYSLVSFFTFITCRESCGS